MATPFGLERFRSFWRSRFRKKCCRCKEESQCNTRRCPCHTRGKQCTNCRAQSCTTRPCCKCNTESECNTNDCDCRTRLTRCDAGCRAERCSNSKVCCRCDEDSECNTDTCGCYGEGTTCTSCCAKSCKERCCKCNTESECNTNDDCDCRTMQLRCDAGCRAERCSNSKVTTRLTECCWCNEESECNTEHCDCHKEGKKCIDCVTRSCKNRCCQCDEESECNSYSCICHILGRTCRKCLAKRCKKRCCQCNTESECNTNDCDCRSRQIRCDGGCRAERCSNSKVTNKIQECCRCNDESECNTKNCDCHARGKQCTNCPAKRCQNRCCQCTEGSECNRNDNCACRSRHIRCANCLTKECTNHKITTTLTECCLCNGESECNSNNCACHSRHTRCSANCFAGGCTNSKRTGECKECCRCIEGSKCEGENCECRSDESPCSCGCLASGCVKQIPRHNTVMGQAVDPYISKKRIQRIVKRQTMSNTQRDASRTSDAERKMIRPTLQDTAHTSNIPASPQGPEPAHVTEFLNAWFPHLDTQPYIIPPVHFNTVYVQKVNLAGGHSIKVLKTQEEGVQGQNKRVNRTVMLDRILKKIHYCLSHIKEEAARQGELMVLMSQAKCGSYGAHSRSLYTGAVAMNTDSKNTEALDLRKEGFDQHAMNTDSKDTEALDLRKEGFDLLLIHRQHGVMMVTVRTTEDNPGTLQEDIRKAVDYLEKAKQVVEDRVVNDVTPKPAIHQAILLPNVTRDCLRGQLVTIRNLRVLEQRLGVEPGRSFSEFCLCEDDMTDNTRVERWWTTCLKRDVGADPPMMGQDVYRQLVTK